MSVLVLATCLVNAASARLAIWLSKKPDVADGSPQKLYAIMSFSYLGAMLASNHALKFISYPAQVLGKSAKPIPVMILGVVLARKKYPCIKYLFVLMITMGVAFFIYRPSPVGGSKTSTSPMASSPFGWGEFLLAISLVFDGITGGVQDKLRAEHRTQAHRMMLWMNTWSAIYLLAGLLVTGEGYEFTLFAWMYPHVIVQLLVFSICSAVGQHFIFMTITAFGPLTCSIITTTRKFFTILSSVVIFQHPLSTLQWLGTALVFSGLLLDSAYGKERRMLPSVHKDVERQ
jgi:UDP-galactose transporter B1